MVEFMIEKPVYDVGESSTADDRVRFQFDIPTYIDGENTRAHLDQMITQKKIELQALENLYEKIQPAVEATAEPTERVQVWVNDFGPDIDVGV